MSTEMSKVMERYTSIKDISEKMDIYLTGEQQIMVSELLSLGDSLKNKRQSGLTTLLALMVVDRLINDKKSVNLYISDNYQINKIMREKVHEMLSILSKKGMNLNYKVFQDRITFQDHDHYSSILFIKNKVGIVQLVMASDYIFIDNAEYIKKEVLLSLLNGLKKKTELYMASTG